MRNIVLKLALCLINNLFLHCFNQHMACPPEYKVGQSVGASLNFVRFDNLNPLNETAPYDKSNFQCTKVAIIIFDR